MSNYKKEYYQKNKKEILTKMKEYSKRPKVKKRRKEYMREYQLNNKEYWNEKNRKWKKTKKGKEYSKKYQAKYVRNEVLFRGNGKRIYGIKKRPYPKNQRCELCQKEKKLLTYHHWDDNDLVKGKKVKGIWICQQCHLLISLLEKYPNYPEIFADYQKLKEQINKRSLNKIRC